MDNKFRKNIMNNVNRPSGNNPFDVDKQLWVHIDNGVFYYKDGEWEQSDSSEVLHLIDVLNNVNLK